MNRNKSIAHLYRTNVEAFVDFAFRELHPGRKLIWRWYLDVIVDRVDAVLKGKCKRLVINAPPRTLKTLIATLALIAMYIGRNPQKQVLLIAGHPSLANDLMKRLRRLMGSARYKSVFPNLRLTFAGTTIRTAHGGGLRIATVGQQLSGHGADLVVVDDPLSPHRASDPDACKETNNWFDYEVLQRLNNRDEGSMVLVMQRVQIGDLSGHLKDASHKFEYVVLPSIATEDEFWVLADGQTHTRLNGEVLHPDTDSREKQAEMWVQSGSFVYATQHLQCTAGTADGPTRLVRESRGDKWTPENWSRRGGFKRITLDDKIRHYAFGLPLPEHATWVPKTQFLSDEEWEAAAAVHTRRMDELRRDPATGESWMTLFRGRS